MGPTGVQFWNAMTRKVEAQHFGKFIRDSDAVVEEVIVEETSGDDGDITSPRQARKSLGIPPARAAGGSLYRE